MVCIELLCFRVADYRSSMVEITFLLGDFILSCFGNFYHFDAICHIRNLKMALFACYCRFCKMV